MSVSSVFSAEYPIKNHHVYLVNKTAFPITFKYEKCIDSKMPDSGETFTCDHHEISKTVPAHESIVLGDYVSRVTYKVDGEYFMVTYIGNNTVKKHYSDDRNNNNEIRCYGGENSLILIDDYKNSQQLYCNWTRWSGVKL